MTVPLAIDEFGALIVIESSEAAATVKVKLFDVIPFWLAVMLLDPAPTPVARALVLRLAAAGFEELQVAELVRSCVVPSVKVPIAVNCAVLPFVMDERGALTLIDWSGAFAVKFKPLFEALLSATV